MSPGAFLPSPGSCAESEWLEEALLGVVADDVRERPMTERWRNWSGSVDCAPARIVSPASEAELVALLATGDGPVRVAGAGHSFTPVCETDGTLVSLDAMSGIVSTDADAPGGPTATIWAGTRLHDLGEPLHAAGYGLANMGDIDRQALAGAVSTGTHGTGRTLGSISTQVVGLRLVLADGDGSRLLRDARAGGLQSGARLALGRWGSCRRSRCGCCRPTCCTSAPGPRRSRSAWSSCRNTLRRTATSSSSGARPTTPAP